MIEQDGIQKFEDYDLLVDSNGDHVWSEEMLLEFYDSKRMTVRDNLKKVIEDNLGTLTEIRQTGKDGKLYKTKVYDDDAMLALGMRLRSPKAIRYQKFLIELFKSEVMKWKADYNKAKISSDIAWRMLDREDRNELYN